MPCPKTLPPTASANSWVPLCARRTSHLLPRYVMMADMRDANPQSDLMLSNHGEESLTIGSITGKDQNDFGI